MHRSRLVRLLDRWTPVEAPRRDLAERLAQWLGVREAIALQEAHGAIAALEHGADRADARPAEAREGRAAGRHALEEELNRLRTTLRDAILREDLCALRTPGNDMSPYHHCYLRHQRRMADSIGTLRNRVRQALAGASPRLARLALLDATLEQLLGRREQQALASVPAVLRARGTQLHEQHTAQLRELFPPAPGAWLDGFDRDFREALLAELELRLQPVTGLVEAGKQEPDTIA